MAGEHTTESQANPTVPLWMRKGTLWTIVVLATIALALIAYYLLPGWWAELVKGWVGASTPWVTGLLLGFTLLFVGITALRIAHRISPDSASRAAGPARLLLGIVAAVMFVVVALTVFIAWGVTEPLAKAREIWDRSAPGLLAATVVGALISVVLMLGLALVVKHRPVDSAPELPSPELEPPGAVDDEAEGELEPAEEGELIGDDEDGAMDA